MTNQAKVGPYKSLARASSNTLFSATMFGLESDRESLESSHVPARYEFSTGQSPFPPPAILTNALSSSAGCEGGYVSPAGLLSLRSAVNDFLEAKEPIGRRPNDILIGPGCKSLLYLLQTCYDAELVLPSPSWVSYVPQAKLLGRRVCWLRARPEDNWRITAEALDKHCYYGGQAARLFILSNPSNPSGTVYTESELSDIGLVAKKHRMLVVSDQVLSDIWFRNEPASLAKYYPEGTILLHGISKAYGAGGWRLGVMSLPSELTWLQKTLKDLMSETFSSASAPIQRAAVKVYERWPELQTYLNIVRVTMQYVLEQSHAMLATHGLLACPVDGGFCLLVNFQPFREVINKLSIQTDVELRDYFYHNHHISMTPGSAFGLSPYSLYLRLALVDFSGQDILLSCGEQIPSTKVIRKVVSHTLEGVDALCSWSTQVNRKILLTN